MHKFFTRHESFEIVLQNGVESASGSIHQLPKVTEQDKNKQQYLETIGLTVLRFTNDEAENDVEKVKEKIANHIESLKNNNTKSLK